MTLPQEAALGGRPPGHLPRGESVIAVSGLEFRWRDDGPAVLAIDAVEVRRGERVFVEGPSGSGKSTLLSLLAGPVTPQRGQITVHLPEINAAERFIMRTPVE